MMIYIPKVDMEIEFLNRLIATLGLSGGATSADQLSGMGNYVIPFLFNAWENPPEDFSPYFNVNTFYNNMDFLLRKMIARDDLTLEQLQRYRRLITSEKSDKQ